MKSFTYNDKEFTVEKAGNAWDIKSGNALVAAGLFPGVADADAEAKAVALVKTIYPVGMKSVGPDTTHPIYFGDLKIIGPDVTHPNFIYWNKESSSQDKW